MIKANKPEITKECGFYIERPGMWRIVMSCGQVAEYPINGIPTEDVPCPCGDPNHWFVKYGGDQQ